MKQLESTCDASSERSACVRAARTRKWRSLAVLARVAKGLCTRRLGKARECVVRGTRECVVFVGRGGQGDVSGVLEVEAVNGGASQLSQRAKKVHENGDVWVSDALVLRCVLLFQVCARSCNVRVREVF